LGGVGEVHSRSVVITAWFENGSAEKTFCKGAYRPSHQKEEFSLADMKVLLNNQTNAERNTWITKRESLCE